MKSFAVVLILSFAVPVFPQSAVPLATPEPPDSFSDQVVVTAASVPETVETTPASVTVITREQIERRESRDIAEALREVPGVIVSRTGSQGKVTSLLTRGGNSTHTLVLWNGIEINNPYFSGYDWGRFSTAGVERIEVVRGPFSALYGSDAVTGVVNVLTTGGRLLNVELESGGNGLLNGSVSGAFTSGSVSTNASFESRRDDGFAPNDDFEQESVLLGTAFAPSDRFSIGVQGRYTQYDLGIPRNVNADGTAFVPSPQRRLDGNELQWAVPVRFTTANLTWRLSLSESRRTDDFSDPEDPFFFTDSTTESKTGRMNLSVQTPTVAGTLIGGFELEEAEVTDVSVYGPNLVDEQRSSRSFFVENRFSRALGAAQFEVTAGLRHDHYDTFGGELSPRIASALIFGSSKVRIGYGHAFRAPSVGELYYPFFGNAALEPERSRSAEVGFDRFIGANGVFSATLFHNDFDNLIVYDNLTNVFQNIGAAVTQGVELSGSGVLRNGWSAAASYTWLDTEQQDTGEALLRRPEHSGSLSIGYAYRAWRTTVVAVHNGTRADVTDLAPFGRVTNDAYTTADATVQYAVAAFVPYLKLENVTDEEYQEVFGYPSQGRRLVAGLRYTLK